MTNPEFGPEANEEFKEQQVHEHLGELADALQIVTLAMRDLARNSTLNNVDLYLPEEMKRLRTATHAAEGLPIQGELHVNSYFMAADGIYRRGVMPFRKYAPYDFQGVFRGIGEVPTPTLREGQSIDRLCIAVDPLYTLRDAALSHYYAERGWHNQLRHPIAQDADQDTRLYIPADSLGEKPIALLDHWKAQA